nr:hypothetical protein [Tanacetum cinerariifolium]
TCGFELLLESFSTYCRGSGAICVECIEFKSFDNVETNKCKVIWNET